MSYAKTGFGEDSISCSLFFCISNAASITPALPFLTLTSNAGFIPFLIFVSVDFSPKELFTSYVPAPLLKLACLGGNISVTSIF